VLYLFDLDGTLISSYMDAPGRNYDDWHVLPGRVERLAELRARGNKIAIVTNQGSVAFGYVDEQHAWSKIYQAVLQCGLYPDETRTYACFHDVRGKPPYNDRHQAARRKPSGQMIREAMADHGLAANDPQDRLQVLFVGDREEDQGAAQRAGVSFQWAHIFFKD
jgi:D-glycero-D-manno-heptose 1,7-bisphosphate phosphatase